MCIRDRYKIYIIDEAHQSRTGATKRFLEDGRAQGLLRLFIGWEKSETINELFLIHEFKGEGKWKNNESWVTPGGDTTRKCFTGDPVTGTGWVMPGEQDRRFLQSTGPFTMNPNDTQIIIVAQVIARGSSNLGSISSLRSTDDLAQRIFDQNFQVPASAPVVPTQVYAPGNGIIYLSWSDTCEKISIPNKLSGGTYKFQGYNIYQIKPGTSGGNEEDRVLMATYDIKDGVGDIQDSIFNTQYGVFIYYTVQQGTNNGISRYFVMDRDYVNNNQLYNGTPVSYTHLRAHETVLDIVCRLLLEKKKTNTTQPNRPIPIP